MRALLVAASKPRRGPRSVKPLASLLTSRATRVQGHGSLEGLAIPAHPAPRALTFRCCTSVHCNSMNRRSTGCRWRIADPTGTVGSQDRRIALADMCLSCRDSTCEGRVRAWGEPQQAIRLGFQRLYGGGGGTSDQHRARRWRWPAAHLPLQLIWPCGVRSAEGCVRGGMKCIVNGELQLPVTTDARGCSRAARMPPAPLRLTVGQQVDPWQVVPGGQMLPAHRELPAGAHRLLRHRLAPSQHRPPQIWAPGAQHLSLRAGGRRGGGEGVGRGARRPGVPQVIARLEDPKSPRIRTVNEVKHKA
jgi:hypothetical protein